MDTEPKKNFMLWKRTMVLDVKEVVAKWTQRLGINALLLLSVEAKVQIVEHGLKIYGYIVVPVSLSALDTNSTSEIWVLQQSIGIALIDDKKVRINLNHTNMSWLIL